MSDIKDYGQIFCEAVDQIVKERLNGISYDSTVLCTIIDDSQKDLGLYIVSNGSSKFQAYSSITTYTNDTNVYVQIPQGDWNAQKFIVGKKNKTEVEEAYVYNNPFASFIDMTGNLIKVDIPSTGKTQLVANDDETESVILWSYNRKDKTEEKVLYKQDGLPLTTYTRLGIKAQFQSWVNPYMVEEGSTVKSRRVVEGEYGLRLRVEVINDKTASSPEETVAFYDLELNTNDMNGNPLNFQTYFQQEKIFDITSFDKINSMALEFYQKAGSFKDEEGQPRIYKQNTGFGEVLISPNLFVKDIYISLGYDANEFDEELVKIYTLQEPTYWRKLDNIEDNHKQIHLRWIHKQTNGTFRSITENDNLDFEVRWYRYSLGASSADEYSGVYWKKLATQRYNNERKVYEYSIEDNDISEYNKNLSADAEKSLLRDTNFFSTWLIPDVALQNEKIKAIIVYNGKPYRSNILTFENDDEVVSRPTVDAIQALTINCEDGTYGNYRIYAEGNQLINTTDAAVERKFKVYFNSEMDGPDTENYELVEARNIHWTFPKENSMIQLPQAYKDIFENDSFDGTEDNPQSTQFDNIDTRFWIADGNYHIKRFSNKDNGYKIHNEQPYFIKGYYSEQYSNNTITCTIEKEPNTFFTATKDLTFGIAGTTGTDVTLVIDFLDSSIHAIDIKKEETTKFIAHLYDSENKDITEEIKNNSEVTIDWGWLGATTGEAVYGESAGNQLYIVPNNDPNNKIDNNQCFVSVAVGKTQITENDWNILCCKVTGWGDYALEAYLPIPLTRSDKKYNPKYIQGASRVIYTSEGHPNYYKGPYELYYTTDENESDIISDAIEESSWDIVPKNNSNISRYYPTLVKCSNNDKRLRLEALNFYVDKSSSGISVVYQIKETIVWSQPLLIMQNHYPSAMLNKWNGSLKIDENDNSILASKIGAGRKNDDNTFSGVLMGNVDNDLDSAESVKVPQRDEEGNIVKDEEGNPQYSYTSKQTSTTGIYGFNHGALSFGFRDNGTAFIGKSGHGRIIFDGDKGVIKSSEWNETDALGGMRLDLDDAKIDFGKALDSYEDEGVDKYKLVELNADRYLPNKYYYLREYVGIKFDTNTSQDYILYKPATYENIDLSIRDQSSNELRAFTKDEAEQFFGDFSIPYFYIKVLSYSEIGWSDDRLKPELDADGNWTGNYEYDTGYADRWKSNGEWNGAEKVETEKIGVYDVTYEFTPIKNYNEYLKAWNSQEIYRAVSYEKVQNPDIGNYYYYYINDDYSDTELNIDTQPQKAESVYFDPTLTYYKDNQSYQNNGIALNLNRYITLSADQKNFPFAIGSDKNISSRKFKVAWDGTTHITDGYFSGTIDATNGIIDYLQSKEFVGNVISGAQITGSSITATQFKTNSLTCYSGTLGGWTIGGNYLRGGQIMLSANGTITGGTIKGSNLYGTTGQIAGWYFTQNTFQNKDNNTGNGSKATIRLNSKDGSIQGGILRTQQTSTDNTDKGGMILDGYLKIRDPAVTTETKAINGSYFGYLKANTTDPTINANSDGFGMQIARSGYTVRSVVTTDSVGYSYLVTSADGKTLSNNISIESSQIDVNAGSITPEEGGSNISFSSSGITKFWASDLQFGYGSSSTWDGNYSQVNDRIRITQDEITIGTDFSLATAIQHVGALGSTYTTQGSITIGCATVSGVSIDGGSNGSFSAGAGGCSVGCGMGVASLSTGKSSVSAAALSLDLTGPGESGNFTIGIDSSSWSFGGGDITFGATALTLLAPGEGKIETSSEVYINNKLTTTGQTEFQSTTLLKGETKVSNTLELSSNFNQTGGGFTSNAEAQFTTSVTTPVVTVNGTLNASGATCIGVYAVLQ